MTFFLGSRASLLYPQIATTAVAATLKKTMNRGLPNCVLRAGNISFDKLNMLWKIKSASTLSPVLLMKIHRWWRIIQWMGMPTTAAFILIMVP